MLPELPPFDLAFPLFPLSPSPPPLRACLSVKRCRRMWLDDHLISPIQRIPRYVLLLRDLLKRTVPDHPDYGHVQNVRGMPDPRPRATACCPSLQLAELLPPALCFR